MRKKELQEIFELYDLDMNLYVAHRSISIGHINTTEVLYFDYGNRVKRYLLQQINTRVFKKPDELMENIENVTIYGKNILKANNVNNYKNKIIRIYKTKDKKTYVKTSYGNYFRIYHYVEGSISFDTSKDPEVFYNAGKAIGFFQNLLADFPADKLHETIKDFHNTPIRYQTFIYSLTNCKKEIRLKCENEVKYFIDNYDICHSIQSLLDEQKMPLRVTHNDTKLNNIMFEFSSNKELCLVDLDTVMSGSICYDFGDFVRSGCNMGEEDSKELSTVIFNKELFIKFAQGYIESVIDSITKVELENLTMGAILMTYECGMRFLTDYLQGNHYFKVSYPEHNLVRCKTQIEMCKQIISCKEELDNTIINIYNNLKNQD